MTLKQICDSIAAWNALRTAEDFTSLNALFADGNSFNYKRTISSENDGENSGKTSYMHVYPGVHNNKLQLYLIPARRDSQLQAQTTSGILPYIEICDLNEFPNLGSEIPVQEAQLRIAAWNDDHEEWIENIVTTKDNIFQAFAIPYADVQVGHDVEIFFALKPNPNPSEDYATADLVIYDESESAVTPHYYDMVRPVPPFHTQSGLQQQDFYLLSIS